jgi:predicted Holliday junction resolvase-like endonuclease
VNLVAMFQEMKQIYGFCPRCGELFRLSDAALYTVGAPPKTAFDVVDASRQRVEQAIDRFEEVKDALRERAVRAGQRQARERLRQIAPSFSERGIDPQDVKVLFDPVDYVAFRGLNGRGVRAIELIDRAPDSARREGIQTSIDKAISRGHVEWRTIHIDAKDGALTSE